MYVRNCGYNWTHPKEYVVSRPDGGMWCILILVRSDAIFVIDGKEYEVTPGSVIILNKHTPHSYHAGSDIFINDWINFYADEKELLDLKVNLGIPINTFIALDNTAQISELIKKLYIEGGQKNISRRQEVKKLYLRLILLKLSDLIHHRSPYTENQHFSVFSELRKDIFSYPKHDWSIDVIRKRLNMSRSYIQHMYKHFFDKSISEDVTKSRIELAQYLLSSTDLSVATIAERCGYNSDVHFMRIFKRETSRTPTEYRKQISTRVDILKKLAKQESMFLYEKKASPSEEKP